MFVGEERMRPLCGVSVAAVPAGSRPFAAETPPRTAMNPAADQATTSSEEHEQHDQHEPSPPPAEPPARGLLLGPGAVGAGRSPRLALLLSRVPLERNVALRPGRRGRRDRACLRRRASGGLRYPLRVDGKHAIGVDLGGTKILAGVVARDGSMVRRHERPTPTRLAGASCSPSSTPRSPSCSTTPSPPSVSACRGRSTRRTGASSSR